MTKRRYTTHMAPVIVNITRAVRAKFRCGVGCASVRVIFTLNYNVLGSRVILEATGVAISYRFFFYGTPEAFSSLFTSRTTYLHFTSFIKI